MSEVRTVIVTFITRPACKLIIKRGILSTDYFSYCDKIGCDVWDTLEKVPNRLDKVSFVILLRFLVSEGTLKASCKALTKANEYNLCSIFYLVNINNK